MHGVAGSSAHSILASGRSNAMGNFDHVSLTVGLIHMACMVPASVLALPVRSTRAVNHPLGIGKTLATPCVWAHP